MSEEFHPFSPLPPLPPAQQPPCVPKPATLLPTRFVLAEEIDTRSVQPWQFAVLGAQDLDVSTHAEAPADAAPAALPDAADTESPASAAAAAQPMQELMEQARAQAYAQGLQEGAAQMQAQIEQLQQDWQQRMDAYVSAVDAQARQRLQAAQNLLQQTQESLHQLQNETAREVLQLACDIARQVIRQELRSQPDALLPVVREALHMLVGEQQPARVRLHPDDLALLQPLLQAQSASASPTIECVADASLAPGDACVECAGAQIDARLEKRWQRAIAALGLVGSWNGPQRSDTEPGNP